MRRRKSPPEGVQVIHRRTSSVGNSPYSMACQRPAICTYSMPASLHSQTLWMLRTVLHLLRNQVCHHKKTLSPKLCSAAVPERRSTLEVALLEALLDLIDRCSSGSGSLHGNEAFLAQAKHVLSSLQEFTATRDSSALEKEGIGYLSLENKTLQSRLAEQQQQYTATVTKMTAELNNTKRELDTLRQHLDKSLEENSHLKSLLYNVKKEVKTADTSTALTLQITGLQASMKQLSGEVVELKQHVEHYDKIQELTQMLQESHSSLVSTNEHLLQELSRTRAQHRAEVEQMRWSFQEFKKTTALIPHRSSRRGGRQSC